MGSRRPALSFVSTFLCASALSACTVGPDFLRPKAPENAGYTAEKLADTVSADIQGGVTQRFVVAKDIPGEWWTLFHSAALNTLIEEALKANPDLAAAQAALRQANEIVYADQGAFFPTLSASGSATREKISAASLAGFGVSTSPRGARSIPPFSVTSASLSVSYAPDVFGGTRRQVESAEAQAEYERFELEATYLTLTSNVVNAAVTLASLRDQIAATDEVIKIESDQLNLLKHQFELGAVSKSDVLTQQATLAQAIATLPPLQKQLAQARNQLMTYLGRFPNQDKGENFVLASLTLPEDLPVSLPSKLVEQRPDIRAAEAQLHEASANVGVAIADQLPQFSITGQLGSSASSFDKLFSPGGGLWSIAGSLAQTIFDGGTLEHRKRAAVAAYDQSAAQYRSTVLSAFQDVANALRAVQTDSDALKAQLLAEQSAHDNLDLARDQYKLGAINYLTLLTAQQTYQNALLNRVRAQAARYTDTAALFQALGGGWWNRADVAPETQGRPDRFAIPPVQEIGLPLAR
ncbi:MAG TPA: efflux transporter outer membrane subunit [Alphaproteobacteria bacterium]|nr:efflux transporter outer membrane subunit [Alphaproteobacteria bacterium]